MPSILAVMGPAGTGKTTRLLELAGQHAGTLLTQPHQRLLAMSFMNGARARLDSALRKSYPGVPRTVRTLDKVAMMIVNRWRVADSLTFPIATAASVDAAGPAVCHFRSRLSFDDIIGRAIRMLGQPAVSSWLTNSFPLVVVDEFQDCHSLRLNFVQTLSSITQVLLAADEFQMLNPEYPAVCPAVEWIQAMEASSKATVERLTITRRTNKKGLLDAANALRSNKPATGLTIPTICAPAIPLLASQCMYFMLNNWPDQKTPTTWALLTPSLDDPSLPNFLPSLDNQMIKKGLHPIRWATQNSGDSERLQMLSTLGVTGDSGNDDDLWAPVADQTEPLNIHICATVKRFARLRGLSDITNGLVRQFAETALHGRSAYAPRTPRFVLTTIHGAKNREFDNVVIFWGFKRPPDALAQRKLLYNAITRAKKAAILLMFDPKHQVSKSAVVSLLGQLKVLGARPKVPAAKG